MAVGAQSISVTSPASIWGFPPIIYMVCVSQVKGASEEASQEVISNQSRSVCGQETRRGSRP